MLRQEGHKVTELREVLPIRASDVEVFSYAREHGLFLITCNRDDFLPLAAHHSNPGMKITSKGQVTIPQDLRERFGLLPNTEVEFVPTADGRELRLLKSAKSSGRGRALVERLRGRGSSKLSTDELLKMMRSEV